MWRHMCILKVRVCGIGSGFYGRDLHNTGTRKQPPREKPAESPVHEEERHGKNG